MASLVSSALTPAEEAVARDLLNDLSRRPTADTLSVRRSGAIFGARRRGTIEARYEVRPHCVLYVYRFVINPKVTDPPCVNVAAE